MPSVVPILPTIALPNVTGRTEVDRVSRTRLNMQSSYAALDRRAENSKKQRWLDSGSLELKAREVVDTFNAFAEANPQSRKH
jgi:hypothetical protein